MKQILLIDDDRDDAELFKEALSELDASIGFEHYEDSKEGLRRLLERQSVLPDIIFLDINMPVVSGWQCLTEFKKSEHLKDITVIMFTTSSQPRERELAQELGAEGFITKPSDYKTLKTMLSSVIKN
ncbi:MAG TPA: response regulator [Flavisolibacter sp.]|nr:response regulator [Flavisolibacter sp.]